MEPVGNTNSPLIASVRIYTERGLAFSQQKSAQPNLPPPDEGTEKLRELAMMRTALRQIEKLGNSTLLDPIN